MEGKRILENRREVAEHCGIGFAATKYGEIGVTIDISVGVCQGTSELSAMQFLVTPLGASIVEGKTVFNALGNPSSLRSPALTSVSVPPSGIVASPKITVRIPSGTVAIRVEVIGYKGGDDVTSVTLPIRDQPTTAVVGTVQ